MGLELLIFWTDGLKTKKMSRFFILILFILISNRNQAQDSTLYTLKQCVDLAIKNNLDLSISGFQSQIAGARLQQSRAALLPYANAYGSQGINKGKSINPYTNTFVNQEILTGQYGVSGGITLFNGFNLLNLMRQNYFNNEAGKMDFQQAKLDITINVMLAYLQILSNQALLSQATAQLNVSSSQVDRLATLDKSNAISPSVLYDTKGQLANDKLTLINAKSYLTSSKISLERLLNINLPLNVKFEKIDAPSELIPYSDNAESVFSNASKSLPLIKSAEFRRMSAVKNTHALWGQIFPTVSLNGSFNTNYSDAAVAQKITGVSDASTDNYVVVSNTQVPVIAPQYQFRNEKISFDNQFHNNLNSYVGLSVQVPIFNGLRTRTQLKIAKINKNQAEAQQSATTVRLKNNVNQAYTDMNTAYERFIVLQEQVKDYSESFKIATLKFEKGAITTVDYVIAKNNIDRANTNLINARYDYILKSKVLDYYQGKINY